MFKKAIALAIVLCLVMSGFPALAVGSAALGAGVPKTITASFTAPMISAGRYETVGLRSNGTVATTWGGYPADQWNGLVQVSAGMSDRDLSLLGLKSDGTVIAAGDNSCGQCNVGGWTGIKAVSAGLYHSVGLKNDGTVVAVGENNYGQCNLGTWRDIKAIAAGWHFTVGLKNDGTVVAAGLNTKGECNVGAWSNIVAVSVSGRFSVGLKSDGTVVYAGWIPNVENLSGWTDIVAIDAGDDHCVGLKSNGTVVATGRNVEGQCNVSGWVNIVAISGGRWHTAGLKRDGTVVAAGGNSNGQANVSGWDLQVPTVPNSLKAISTAYNAIQVSWQPSEYAAGYELWRATNNSPYARVALTTSTSVSDIGLETAREYRYKVRAYGGSAGMVYSDFSPEVTAVTRPAAPTNVKATSVAYNSIKLTWSAVPGAQKYYISRATSSAGPYTDIASTEGGMVTSFINSPVTCGTIYYYKVAAARQYQDSSQYGGWHWALSEYSACVAAKTVLGTPSSPKAVPLSYSSIKLTWAAVPGATMYEVYRAVTTAGTYAKLTETASLSYTNTGLTTGAAYYYKIRAKCVVGSTTAYGGFSAVVSASTVPAAPVVKAASASYTSIMLTWAAVPGATMYEVYRAVTSAGTYTKLTETASLSYTNTGLTTGAAYYYKIRAKCIAGTTTVYGGFSVVVSARPVPAAPVVKAASASYTSIKLTWGAVAGATKYEVYRATTSAGTYTKLTETTSTSYTNTSLATGATYYYKVRAYRLVGTVKVYGGYSAIVSTKPVPAAPANASAVRTSSTSIKVRWGAVAGATKYEVWRCTTSATGTYALMTTTASTYYTNTRLTMGKTYWYKVRAYRLVGTVKVYSNFSAVVSAKP